MIMIAKQKGYSCCAPLKWCFVVCTQGKKNKTYKSSTRTSGKANDNGLSDETVAIAPDLEFGCPDCEAEEADDAICGMRVDMTR